MAFNLQSYHRMSALIDESDWEAGSLEKAFNVAVAGNTYSRVFTISDSSNTQIFAAQLTSFDYLFVASNQDCRLALTDTSSNALSVTILGTGEAKKYGAPFVLQSAYTLNTSVTINSITAFNSSGSAARVRIVAVD